MHGKKLHFRLSLLLLFNLKKYDAEAHQTLVRFKSGNFDINDKEPVQQKEIRKNGLQALLDENYLNAEKTCR